MDLAALLTKGGSDGTDGAKVRPMSAAAECSGPARFWPCSSALRAGRRFQRECLTASSSFNSSAMTTLKAASDSNR